MGLFTEFVRSYFDVIYAGMGGGGMGPPSSQHSRHDSREQQDGRARGWGGGGHQRSVSTPAGGLQFGNLPQQHYQQQQVWANNGYHNQQHQQYQQYQAPYGYGGYGMMGNGGSPQLQHGRDRDSRGHREQEERQRREYSRERHGEDRGSQGRHSHGRDRSYDRYQNSRR